MTGYFVAGTDTGVGKTYVTAALTRRARELSPSGVVFAFKPVETGCTADLGDDQRLLVEAAGNWQRGPLRGAYQFKLPAAPLVAAEAEAKSIDLDRLEQLYLEGSSQSSLALVEGAGGWRVPLTQTADMASLALRLNLPVIVVARAGLGTINHSLLTLEAVERDGCTAAALVLSRRPEEDEAFAHSNAEQIGRRWSGPIYVFGSSVSVLDTLL